MISIYLCDDEEHPPLPHGRQLGQQEAAHLGRPHVAQLGGGPDFLPDALVEPFRHGGGYGGLSDFAGGGSAGISGPLLYAGAGDGGIEARRQQDGQQWGEQEGG